MSWPLATLESLASDEARAITDGPFGSNLARQHYTSSGPRVIRLQNIGDGEFIDNPAHISQAHFERLRAHEVLPGDLLIASLGDVLPRGCLAPGNLGPAIVKADCIRVRLAGTVDPKWVLYSLQRPAVRRWADDQRHGVGRPRLGLGVIRRIPVPAPGIEEQRRIVAILEEHLSDLDDAASSLRRASVRCQALVTRSLSLVRSGDELPLPQVAVIQGGIQKQAKRTPHSNAFPFLRVANVTARGLELDEVHRIELFRDELTRYGLHAGDLLVVEGNGSPSQIGRAALWDGSIPDCVHQNHLIRVRPDREKILPEYLEAVWNSPENRSVLTEVASSSSGLHTLSVRKLAQLQIPVPSLERQIAAIAELRQVRESVSRLQASISASAARGESLRRAVLAAAFSGGLTGRDSDAEVIDELAEEEYA